jgi:hypothetical protein
MTKKLGLIRLEAQSAVEFGLLHMKGPVANNSEERLINTFVSF